MSEPARQSTGQPVSPAEAELMGDSAAIRRAGQARIQQALELWHQFKVARTAELQRDAAPFLDRMLAALKPLIEAHERDQAEAFQAYCQIRDRVTAEVEETTRRLREEHMQLAAERNADRPTCPDCGSHRLIPGGCLNCMYPPGSSRAVQQRSRGVPS